MRLNLTQPNFDGVRVGAGTGLGNKKLNYSHFIPFSVKGLLMISKFL